MTAKQKRFCEEYVIDLNATQAAIRAGYAKISANRQASVFMTKHDDIKTYIKELQDKKTARNEITADRVLEEIRRIAFFDTSRLYESDGRLKEPHELTSEEGAVISSFKTRMEGGESKSVIDEYKTYDKQKSLEMLCKHLGLFEAKDGANDTAVPKIVISLEE